jgi:hypothetical protein
MKKLVLASLALTCAVSVFAQGTVVFNNRVSGTIITYVYAMNPANNTQWQIGNGPADTPPGTTDWTGWTRAGGNGYTATLRSAPGAGAADAALQFAAQTTTFRTGTGAGNLSPITLTLPNVAAGAPVATLQMFAWDNKGGTLTDPAAAWAAWQAGTTAGGVSAKFDLANIGGGLNTNPNLVGLQSFNLYMVPEPSTLALAGLGAAALLLFRRRQ